MIDLRTEIRGAFAREQAAFPPPAALRAQVVAAVNARDRAAAPERHRSDRNLDWLLVAAAALLTIAIVAGLIAVRLNIWPPILVKPGPAPQRCVPGATSPSDRFARVHGCVTYIDGNQIVAVDPYHPANRIILGPANGLLPLTWSRDGSRLLLMSTVDLYVMNADGSQTRLTHGDSSGFEGSLSPDGSKLVYDRWQETVVPGGHLRTAGLYILDVQGGAPRLLAKSDVCVTVPDNQNAQIQQGSCATSSAGSMLTFPTWSPDGSRIAYADSRYDLATDEVWTMNSDGTNQRRVVSLGSCGATQPTGCTNGLTWSPDSSQLAIHSVGGIYTVRADGSRLLRISKDGAQPSWSPDGSRIAFTRGGELFTMAPNGSNVTIVRGVVVAPPYGWAWNPVAQPTDQLALARSYITYTHGAEIWAVDPNNTSNQISLGPSHDRMPIGWSRDGSRLLLVAQTDVKDSSGAVTGIKRDLYVMNRDGSQKRLTSDGMSLGGSLSPDGGQVVFARQDLSLYVIDTKGGTPQRIVDSRTSWYSGSAAWFPDGSRIAYTQYLEFGPKGPAFEIWTVKPDGNDPRRLVDLGPCGGGGCTGALAWSPDGSMLAFNSERDIPLGTPVKGHIWLVRADGSGLHRINDDGSGPSWSPDGSRIAFARGGQLFTMTPDGRNITLVEGVFIGPPDSPVAWNPAT